MGPAENFSPVVSSTCASSTRAYRVFHRSSPNLDGVLTHRSELVSTFWKRFQNRATRNKHFFPLVSSPASRTQQTAISDARSTGDPLPSVQLPLESAPSDLDEAVQELTERPEDELRQARKHHRRALKALREDTYEALPEETREQLVRRLQTNLTALNKVFERGSEDGEAGR